MKKRSHISSSSSIKSGLLTLHAHYFEDGNVQLQTTKNIEEAQVCLERLR